MQQINVIVTPKAKQTISVKVNGVAMSVVNSDGSYSTTHYSGTPFIIPDITVTDSDGSTYSHPSVKDVVCTLPVGSDVENSDGSYTQHVNNGATLVLPDTVVKNTAGATILTQPSATNTGVIADCHVVNSDATYDENVPAETTHNLPDITHTDSDGTPTVLPAMTPMVCTPAAPVVVGEQFYIQFPAYYKNFIDITIDASSEGTYVDEVLTNVASVIYTVNTVPVTIPFTVVNGDVLGLTITKTDYSCLALVELTNESISPYMFNSVGYTSVYPPAHNATYVKATSSVGGFEPYLSTNPAKSLTGSWNGNQWISAGGSVTNQRFHIDLGSSHIIGRIYYENSHNSGVYINCGVKDFTVWGSNSALDFADLVYANDGTWTQITSMPTLMSSHVGKDQPDAKYIMLNNTSAYRYWALKIDNAVAPAPELNVMGIRRIELQE